MFKIIKIKNIKGSDIVSNARIEMLYKEGFIEVDSLMPFLTNYVLNNYKTGTFDIFKAKTCVLILNMMTASKIPLKPELIKILLDKNNRYMCYEFAGLTLLLYHCYDKKAEKLCKPIYDMLVNKSLMISLSDGRKSKAVRKALEYADKYEAYPNVRKAVKKALKITEKK